MNPHRLSTLFALSIVLLSANPSSGGPICRPHLSVKAVRLSELRNLERTWTASLSVDATRCAADSGPFDIHFMREKENAPELEFTESFTWHAGELGTGRADVSIKLWIDEAVHKYVLYTPPCTCRNQE